MESITGKRLGEVMQERIFAPLGMTNSGFTLTASMRSRLARIHQREADGSLKPLADFELPQEPEVHMGGHGLYSTVGDYCRFIRMWLNDGMGEHGRVLREGGWDRARLLAELEQLLTVPGTALVEGADGIAEGLPLGFADSPVPKFRRGGLLLVHAGGTAGMFSTIIPGWASGPGGSEPTTVPISRS